MGDRNPFVNLVFNVLIPAVILSKLSAHDRLGPVWAMVFALIFPLSYGLRDLIKARKLNPFSILGLFSVTLTGSLGLMKVGRLGFSIKEAAIPAALGVAMIVSLRTKAPLVQALVFNEKLFDLPKIHAALAERGNVTGMRKLMREATWFLAGTFFMSGALNFALAWHFLRSPAGTPEFNAELGKVTAFAFPVVSIPMFLCMILIIWRIGVTLKALTGHDLESLMQDHKKKPAADVTPA